MEAARANWTDSRLDDLNDRVGQVDEKMTRLDEKMDAGFTRVNDRIDKLQHSMIVVGGGLIAAMLTVLAAMLGMVITLLVTHV
jgi:hypothetical protein